MLRFVLTVASTVALILVVEAAARRYGQMRVSAVTCVVCALLLIGAALNHDLVDVVVMAVLVAVNLRMYVRLKAEQLDRREH